MKRIFSFIIILLTAFSLSACGESANMSELSAYQNGNFFAEAKITLGGESYTAEIEKEGSSLRFKFTEPSSLSAFTFIFGENGVSVATDGLEIPLGNGELLKFSALPSLFSVPVEGTWKIKRTSPGGVDVYLCQNGDIALYVDANSHLPLKIAVGELRADILRFEPR